MMYFHNMKTLTILIILFFSIQTSFAQRDSAMLAKVYNDDTITYNRVTENLNKRYDFELCNCEKNDPTIYFHRIAFRPLQDSTGAYYLMHQIFIIEQTSESWKATLHENLTSRVTSPKIGWRAFHQNLDDINISTLPKHFMELEYIVLASPDGYMTWLRVCKNGSPKIYSLQGNVEFITSYGMDMEVYRQSGDKVSRIRKLIKLFTFV